jgi:TonB-dependent SusC/RagA subfamily outer membrane receptor
MSFSTPWKLNTYLCSVIVGLAALATPCVSPGQVATITGTVRDSGATTPLPYAHVTIVGSTVYATTDAQGRYTLRGAPAGAVEVRASRIGYTELKKSVTVPAGGTATLDFALGEVSVKLQEVVTTATGVQRRVELGNTISTLGDVSTRVEQRSITNVSDLLVAKTPGMTILPGNNTGAPPMIRVRGLNSLQLNNAPIFVIDGVRMSSGPIGSGATFAATSFLTGLNPQEIEDVEIVKGPSAATLYGTDAANGVIVITTKRGRAGKTRWDWHVEGGRVQDRNDYLPAYALLGHTSTAPSARCLLIQVAAKSCTIDIKA